LISSVTDEVLDEVKRVAEPALGSVYPIMYLDAIQFKVRDNGHAETKHLPGDWVTIEDIKKCWGVDRAKEVPSLLQSVTN